MATIRTVEALYPAPLSRTVATKRGRIDHGLCAVIAASPFVLLATSDDDGRCDVTPRGGPPGQVKVLDDTRVALPDGNNNLDAPRDIVANPNAGLLFVLLPGQGETLRLDGPGHLATDDSVLDLFCAELRRPVLAVVEVGTVFTPCAIAFRRSRLWDSPTWTDPDDRVLLAARYGQVGPPALFEEYVRASEAEIDADLAHDARPV